MTNLPAFNKNNLIKSFACSHFGSVIPTGVLFKPNETIATNGYIGARVSSIKINNDQFPILLNKKSHIKTNFKPFIVPTNQIDELSKIIPEKQRAIEFLEYLYVNNVNEKTAEFLTTDLENISTKNVLTIKAEYPHLEDIFIQKGGYYEVEVDAKYLKIIADYYFQFTKNEGIQRIKIKIPKKDKDAPIIFFGKNINQKADVALMPIKPDHKK